MKSCDLCGLDVGAKPFLLPASDRALEFCCEGCLGIYQMLHDIKGISATPVHNEHTDPERSKP